MTQERQFYAQVISVQKAQCTLLGDMGAVPAHISGKLRREGSFPVVGDRVLAKTDGSGSCTILGIGERTSVFVREDRGGHADGYVKTMLEEPLAANFDLVFIISSLNRNFSVPRSRSRAAGSRLRC